LGYPGDTRNLAEFQRMAIRYFVKAQITVKISKYHKLLLMVRVIREKLNKPKGEENEKSN
jgi:hypothetical protein